MILTHLQKLPKNVEDSVKLIVAKCLKKLPIVQKIAQSGHTVMQPHLKKKKHFTSRESIPLRSVAVHQNLKQSLLGTI